VPIEQIHVGDLVKTYKHGYLPVTLIGKGKLTNTPGNIWNTMYTHNVSGLTITGNHGVLLDTLTETEKAKQLHIMKVKKLPTIDGKYVLFANFCEQFRQVSNTSEYTYYHLALEDKGDSLKKYGIWAEGVLTETTSRKKFMNHGYDVCV
jgi:hypothetical protein